MAKLTTSFWMALLAIIISLVGTIVSIVEADILRDQQQLMSEEKTAAVWPYVKTSKDVKQEGATTRITFTLTNKGVGPALLGNLSVRFEQEETQDILAVLELFTTDFENLEIIPAVYNITDNEVIGAGEALTVLELLVSASDTSLLADPTEQLLESVKVLQAVDLTYCYCSVYGDCRTSDNQRLTDGEVCSGSLMLR